MLKALKDLQTLSVKRLSKLCFALALVATIVLVLTAPAYAQSVQFVPESVDSPHIPTIVELTPAVLSAIVAAIISVTFRYMPGARDWFEKLTSDQKQFGMFALTVGVALIIGAFSMVRDGVTEAGLLTLLLTVFTALTSNQVTYQFIKK